MYLFQSFEFILTLIPQILIKLEFFMIHQKMISQKEFKSSSQKSQKLLKTLKDLNLSSEMKELLELNKSRKINTSEMKELTIKDQNTT